MAIWPGLFFVSANKDPFVGTKLSILIQKQGPEAGLMIKSPPANLVFPKLNPYYNHSLELSPKPPV